MTILMLLAALAAQSSPEPVDTAVTVQGLLARVPTTSGQGWLLAMPSPFRFRDRPIAELLLAGDSGRWSGFETHYVEVRGSLEGAPPHGPRPLGTLHVDHIREVDPAGTARKHVSTSFTQRAAIVLWVLPNRFRWRDAAGQPTGVGPAIVYTLNNHGESKIVLWFETKDFVCFSVEPKNGGAPAWHAARQLREPRDRQRVALPTFVREMTPLPYDAAPTPGRYIVRAGLCGYKEFELETEIEVSSLRPLDRPADAGACDPRSPLHP